MSIEQLIKAELNPKHDLSDTDLIHFVTLGILDLENNKQEPIVAFTCDNKSIIADRIILQKGTFKKFITELKITKVSIVPGIIYFVNQEECKVIECLHVCDLLDNDCISVQVTHP